MEQALRSAIIFYQVLFSATQHQGAFSNILNPKSGGGEGSSHFYRIYSAQIKSHMVLLLWGMNSYDHHPVVQEEIEPILTSAEYFLWARFTQFAPLLNLFIFPLESMMQSLRTIALEFFSMFYTVLQRFGIFLFLMVSYISASFFLAVTYPWSGMVKLWCYRNFIFAQKFWGSIRLDLSEVLKSNMDVRGHLVFGTHI